MITCQQHVVPKKILVLYLHILFFKTNFSNIRYSTHHCLIKPLSLLASVTLETFLAQTVMRV